jgi:hypothetical protein
MAMDDIAEFAACRLGSANSKAGCGRAISAYCGRAGNSMAASVTEYRMVSTARIAAPQAAQIGQRAQRNSNQFPVRRRPDRLRRPPPGLVVFAHILA